MAASLRPSTESALDFRGRTIESSSHLQIRIGRSTAGLHFGAGLREQVIAQKCIHGCRRCCFSIRPLFFGERGISFAKALRFRGDRAIAFAHG